MRRPTLVSTVDASSTSQGVQLRKFRMRHAKPAMSGNAPRRPMPLDTLPITSHDTIGSPSLDGATRSRMPSATTPMG